MSINSGKGADHIADAVVAMQGVEDPIIPSLREQIRQCENSLKNLLTAIDQGIITPTTKERMEELEAQRDKLNLSLIHAQMEQPVFSKEKIVKWISRFKYGNIEDRDYQKEVIDTLLNAVYIYDDKIGFTYNFKEGAETITLDELNFVLCADMVDCTPPAFFLNLSCDGFERRLLAGCRWQATTAVARPQASESTTSHQKPSDRWFFLLAAGLFWIAAPFSFKSQRPKSKCSGAL